MSRFQGVIVPDFFLWDCDAISRLRAIDLKIRYYYCFSLRIQIQKGGGVFSTRGRSPHLAGVSW